MPDNIRVNEERGIIEVQSYGIVSKEDIVDSMIQARRIFDTKGFNRILVDTTKQEKMPTITDIFDLFSTFPREFRLAMLIQESQVTAEDISFTETVGVNRGVRVKIFHEKEQAMHWLDKG